MNRRTFFKSGIAAAGISQYTPAVALDRSVIGACTAMAGYGLFEAIDALQRLGFSTIEIQPMGEPQATPGRFPGFEFDRFGEPDRRRMRHSLAAFQHVSSHLPYAGLEFFSRDLATVKASVRRLEIAMEATVYFGAELAVLHITPPKGWSLEEAWSGMIRRLREWGDFAKRAKFRLAIETGFPASVVEFVRLIQEVDHPAVGCTIDVGHQGAYKELQLRIKPEQRATAEGIRAYNDTTLEIIGRLKEKIFHFHVHDIDPATWREHQPIGTGFVDYTRLVRTLERMHYRGLLVLEIGGPGSEIEAHLADSKRRLEAYLAGQATSTGGGPDCRFESPRPRVAPVVPIKASRFDLQDVRLLDGPVKTKQELNRRYLKQLDPDRLLYNFWAAAGLPSSAKPLRGWESPRSFCRGHFLGHYMSACALTFASSGDERIREKGAYIVSELAKCQRAFGGEYLGPVPADAFDALEQNPPAYRYDFCVPYYVIHKVFAGLVDMYQLCGNRQALDVASKMANYFKNRLDRCTPSQIQRMFLTTDPNPLNEFGGMSEALHNLYSLTGRARDLQLANVFDRAWFLDPLSRGQDNLTNLHSNTHVPQILGAMRRYELTGEETYRRAALFFWKQVALARSYANGGNSGPRPLGSPRSAGGEHWAEPYKLAHTLTPEICESCVLHNTLKVTSILFSWTADASYADFYEHAYFNSIMGMQHPGYPGGYIYYFPLSSGSRKRYGHAEDSFWCCYGTGVEAFSRLAEDIYFHDSGSLWVNLFVPSVVNWRAKGLKIEQQTRFPEEPGTTLVFHTFRPVRAEVHIRVASWAGKDFKLTINGKEIRAAAQPGSFLAVDRTWHEGDRVEVRMPMSLHKLPMPDDPNLFAIAYGPIVLAALTPEKLVFPVEAADVLPAVRPISGKPLMFALNAGSGSDFILAPLYRVVEESYGVYFTAAPQRG